MLWFGSGGQGVTVQVNNLKTSYVMVRQTNPWALKFASPDLKTSYVMVRLRGREERSFFMPI